MSIADLTRMEEEALETLEQLTKEFEEKGFDSEQLLKDIAEQIDASEIPYQFPAVQRAWVAGKLLTPKPKPEFTRESAYEIFNYIRAFKFGTKAWNPQGNNHQSSRGVYSHKLVAWKVMDDAAKANVFPDFVEFTGKQEKNLSLFVADNSDFASYLYYTAYQWGLPVTSPIFDDFFYTLSELVKALRQECVNHNFHDVVEVINQTFSL